MGVNPLGATKDGYRIDGALPEEMRRGDSFQFPPASTGYAWEGLQGAVVQAEILHRAGYDAWEWNDRAMLRAVEFLYSIDWAPTDDDLWIPWLIDARYGTNFASIVSDRPGKLMGWTAWTHESLGTPAENRAPQVYAGPDHTTFPLKEIEIYGAVVDDGWPEPPTIDWTVLSGPGEVTFGSPTTPQTTVVLGAAGTYVFQLSTFDGELTSTDQLTVTVEEPPPNQAPVVDAGLDQSVSVLEAVSLTGAVQDDAWPAVPGTTTVQWSLVSGPGSVVFGDANAVGDFGYVWRFRRLRRAVDR